MAKLADAPVIEFERPVAMPKDVPETVTRLTDLGELRRFYAFHDSNVVASYLARNPDVVDRLLEARTPLRSFWGDHVSVSIDIVPDPDDPEFDTAVVFIRSAEDVGPSLERLGRFKAAWWGGVCVSVKGKLTFLLDWDDGI
jgi:hypothetical protein